MQTAAPFNLASLVLGGYARRHECWFEHFHARCGTMAASTSVLTTATGVTAVIQSGTVQGSLTSTAASTLRLAPMYLTARV